MIRWVCRACWPGVRPGGASRGQSPGADAGPAAPRILIEIEHTAGLLIEQDNGIYTFAHLTFQEYLAALHVAETKPIDFLMDRLSDSWWREVTLLRVANADATPIVQAVLQVNPPTVETLSLAAECIDQAREVNPDVRMQVADALSCRAWRDDVPGRRVAAHVIFTRKQLNVAPAATRSYTTS